MAQLILTRSSQFHRALRTRSAFPLTLRIGKFFLFFSMTFMIGLLSFFYLVKSTDIHTKGYELGRLDLERARLLKARENQDKEIAKLKSLAAIQASEIASRMIPAQNFVFVKKDSAFAKASADKPAYALRTPLSHK